MTDSLVAVLMPGLDGTGKMFGPLIKHLPDWLEPQVIAYPSKEVLSYAQLTDYVLQRLPAGKDYVMIVESFSGPLALMLNERVEQHPRAMVLCASFLTNPRPWLSKLAPLLLTEWLLSQPPRRWMAKLLITGNYASEDMLNRALTIHKEVSPKVLLQRLYEVMYVDVREQFRRSKVPMLHLYALRDRTVLNNSNREIQSVRPDVKSIGVDGPHFLLQTRAKQCMQHIEAFLADVLHR